MDYLPVLIATLLFGLTILCAKQLEQRYLSPAVIFFYAFFAHCFLAPIAALDVISTYNHETFGHATNLALAGMVFLIAGYVVHGLRISFVDRRILESGSKTLFGGNPYIPSIFLAGFVLALILDFFGAGGFDAVRGEASYSGSSIVSTLSLMAAPMFMAMFVAAYTDGPAFRKVAIPVLAIIFAIFLWVAIVTFARHRILLIILAVGVYFHFRVKAFTGRQAVLAGSLVLIVSMFAGNRRFGGSFVELSFDEVLESFHLFIDAPVDALISLIAPIAGFEVFTQVISIVPSSESYMYGQTYLNSAIGLLFPRFIFGEDFYHYETPAYWFLSVYSPYTIGHGFDFSLLSELYLNFGMVGLVALTVAGYFVGYLSRQILHSSDEFKVFISIYLLTAFVIGLRTDSNALFKSIVYPIGFIILVRWLARVRPTSR